MAFSLRKPIFPVRSEDVAPAPGLALFVQSRHWTDAFGPEREASLERLGAELTASGLPAGATPFPSAAAPAPQQPPPIASAAAGAAADSHSTERETDEEVAIGRNAYFYVTKWQVMDRSKSVLSWNWGAFFGHFIWLSYRKMWGAAAGMAAMMISLTALSMTDDEDFASLIGLIYLIVCGAFAAFANHLYRIRIRRLIAEHGSDLRRLRHVGGTSPPGLIVTLLLWLIWVAATEMDGAAIAPAGEAPAASGG